MDFNTNWKGHEKKGHEKKGHEKKNHEKKIEQKKNAIKKGGGSDWRISQYSRGPVNYPSNKLLFNQFSNSKNYISNENLPKAAVPMNEISEPPFPNKHFSLPNSSAPF